MKHEQGFTLIELLVVIAIISLLASIAIPKFLAFRQNGFDARAKMDLRHIATAEEAYFNDTERYIACNESTCSTVLGAVAGVPSQGVQLQITVSSVTATQFTGTARHNHSSHTFLWDTSQGGLMQ